MNRPNDLLRNLLLTLLCFLVVIGIFFLTDYLVSRVVLNSTAVIPIGLVLMAGFLIASIRLLIICAVTLFCLIRYPLWRSKNEKWALWAVSRVRSPRKLAEIAKQGSWAVALAAVQRLEDADLLEEVAASHLHYEQLRAKICEKLGHDWGFCQCRRCGKTRDEQHAWEGCQCRCCGKTRDEQHAWEGCQCRCCGKTRDEQHAWEDCQCSRCGKTRDEQHAWEGCQCSRCGKTRDEQHDWYARECRRCGKMREEYSCPICGESVVGCTCKKCRACNHIWVYSESILSSVDNNANEYYEEYYTCTCCGERACFGYSTK